MNFEPFLEYCETIKGCSSETIKAYRSDLAKFERFLEERSIIRITQVDYKVIGDYINHMREVQNPRSGRTGLSDASIARRLAAVSTYCDYVRLAHHKFRNPLDDISLRLKKNNRPKPVDEEILDKLRSGISSLRDRTILTMFLASGLRISEMAQLDRDTIIIEEHHNEKSGEDMTVGTGEVTGKGDKRRSFFVDEESLIVFSEYLDTRKGDDHPALFLSERKKRMSIRAMQERLAYWCRAVGVEHINVHRLRHTYATRLANANISSMHLKELMGHNSFTTTLQYFKLTDTTLARGYHAAMEFMKK